jgi:SWI/SNF-related matrix-associated actin-dependent regulator 1 of chromatin subfamily A
VRLYKNGNTYWFKSTYDERLVAKNANFRWEPISKLWYSENIINAAKLVQYADDSCKEELVDIVNSVKDAVSASRATTSTIQIPVPVGQELMEFQKAGVEYCINHNRTLLADAMGTGKTPTSICVINYLNPKNVLIVCPASIKMNWWRELQAWVVGDYTFSILEGSAPDPADIQIVNYDILGKHPELLFKDTSFLLKDTYETRNELIRKRKDLLVKYDLIIVDEAHYCKSSKAQRTKYLMQLVKYCGSRLILMSGTAIVNKPIELFTLLRMLGHDLSKNYMTYTKKYCGAYDNGFGRVVDGASNLTELSTILRSTVMIRRTKEEVLTELPDKTKQIITLPGGPTDKEKNAIDSYQKKKSQLLAEVVMAKSTSREELNKAISKLKSELKIAFEEMSAVRHDSALAKMKESLIHIKNVLDNIDKLVIFAHHHDVIDMLMEELKGYGVVKLDGLCSNEQKQDAIDTFQSDPNVRVFIGSIRAAGVGITLTAASTCILLEFDWSPGVMEQCVDRLHRISQKNAVLVQYLVVDGTIDARMAQVANDKANVIDQVMDGEINEYIESGELFSDTSLLVRM